MATLITGVTGVLGSELYSLLNDDVYCIVRNGLSNNRLSHGIDHEKILEGDITRPMCGLSQDDIKKLKKIGFDRFIHLAANVSFAVDDVDGQIWKVNYLGTFNALELSHELDINEFHYCSTVYAEDERNPYEISKLAAEKLVINSGLKYSIYRPSAIVGSNLDGATSDFNGYYGVYQLLHLLAQKKRNNPFEKVDIGLKLTGSSNSTLNLVPIDWICQMMSRLIAKGPTTRIYHLAQEKAPLARWVNDRSCDALNIVNIEYWESVDERECAYKDGVTPSFMQRQVDRMLTIYMPYVTHERVFCLQSLKDDLGVEYLSAPSVSPEFIKKIILYAVKVNFGHKQKNEKIADEFSSAFYIVPNRL